MQSKEKDLVPYLGGISADLSTVVVTKKFNIFVVGFDVIKNIVAPKPDMLNKTICLDDEIPF